MTGTDIPDNYQIVSPSLTVKAMRDSGYKNTAYALAELIDNSIDANANLVQVFACEEPVTGASRTRHRVQEIAVLDNGSGMGSDTLRRALKYGDGRGGGRDRIGRFGMGLPNSSMSQCKKVEVWSWTNGPANALYTYLDLNEISSGQGEVPEPVHEPIPNTWQALSDAPLGRSGTLVVWSELDRVNWYGAAATLTNTSDLIGRVYRRFLDDGRIRIRMAPVRDGAALKAEYYAKPNDPLYLMTETGTPGPFADKPMFQPFETGMEHESDVRPFPIEANGQVHNVVVRASIARPEARRSDVPGQPWPDNASSNQDAGNHPWGKHAKRNVGISLVRQDRELDLDVSWAIGYDPVERWWGVEVEFPPALDEIFGVTNNKQTATIFSSLAHFDWKTEAEEGETLTSFKKRLEEIGDKRLPLIDLANYLENKLLRAIRRKLKQQTLGGRKSRKRHETDVASTATDAVNKRRDEGHTGQTDALEEGKSADDKRKEQIEALTTRHHVEQHAATLMVDEALLHDLRARWISSPQDTPAFFSIDLMAGMLQVNFNDMHPLNRRLMVLLEETPEDATEDELRDRLRRAEMAFKLLVFSWARMEDEAMSDGLREKIADVRYEWGKCARDFLKSDGGGG